MREIAQSLAVLADEIGPCIIVAHSAGGPLAWWIADTHPDAVGAIVGIAPGPPSNIQRPLPDDPKLIEALRFDESVGCPVYSPPDKPVFVDIEFIRNFWANTSRFPESAIDAYAKSIVPESAAVLNERFNIGGKGLYISGPNVVAARPILVVTGDSDPRHPRTTDAAVADYFNAKHAWLPEHGLHGNGHMLMLEDNSEEIACLVSDWQAGVYGSVLHYLKSVKAAGTDDADKVAQTMREMPINDAFTENAHIREDGRVLRDMYLAKVKAPEASKYPWDYFDIVRTIPAQQTVAPLSESTCPLVKKS